MNNYHPLFVVFLLVCLGPLLEMSLALELSQKDIKAILDKLDDRKHPIGSNETKALLKTMYDATGEKYYSSLSKFAEINEAKCDDGSWSTIMSQLNREYKDSSTGLYVLDCFRNQYVNCTSKFEQNLRAAFEQQLTNKDRKRLELLDDIFIKHIGPTVGDVIEYDKDWIKHIPHLGSSLLQLDSRMKSKLMRKLQTNLFHDESIVRMQLKSVFQMCDKLKTPIMIAAAQPYIQIGVYPLVGKFFPQYALEWIPRYKFCKMLNACLHYSSEKRKQLVEEIVDKYRAEKS